MSLLQLIPNIFYEDITVGINFFTQGLGFKLVYHDEKLYIVKRDNVTLHLIQDVVCQKGQTGNKDCNR